MSDIAQLFATDPLKLSRQDIESIIKEFRAKRSAFNIGNMKAGSTKPPTEKQKQMLELGEKLKIGGLDL